MVNGFGAWSWGVPGPYFGVPYNQIGLWFFLTFAIMGLYRVLELRVPLKPMGETTAFVGLLPVLVYALSGVLDVLGGASLSLTDVTVTGGSLGAASTGGGIRAAGSTSLSGVPPSSAKSDCLVDAAGL